VFIAAWDLKTELHPKYENDLPHYSFSPPMNTNVSSSYSSVAHSKYGGISCIQPAKSHHAMPSKRFVFLGQNSSPVLRACFLCSCWGPRCGFRSLRGWRAKLLWIGSTGKGAEGCEPRECTAPAGIAPQCRQCKAQTPSSLAEPWAGWWVWGFNQEGYKKLQEQTILTPQPTGCPWVNLYYSTWKQKPGPSLQA